MFIQYRPANKKVPNENTTLTFWRTLRKKDEKNGQSVVVNSTLNPSRVILCDSLSMLQVVSRRRPNKNLRLCPDYYLVGVSCWRAHTVYSSKYSTLNKKRDNKKRQAEIS